MLRGWGPLTLITQVGLTIAVSIVLGLLLGLWIDSRFGTTPWFTLILILLGLAVGSIGVYRMIADAIAEAAEQRDHSAGGRKPGDERKEQEE